MSANNQSQSLEGLYRSDGKLKFHKKKTAFMAAADSIYLAIFFQGLVVLCSDSTLNQITDFSTRNKIEKFSIFQIVASACMVILQFVLIKISSRSEKNPESLSYLRGLVLLAYTIILLEIAVVPYIQTQNTYFITLSFTIFFELLLLNTLYILFEPSACSKNTAFFITNVILMVRITFHEAVCLVPCLVAIMISTVFVVVDGNANREILRELYLKNQNGEIYQTFLDLLPEGVAILMDNCNLKYVNNSMKRILGCSEENIGNCILGLTNTDANKTEKSPKKELEKARKKSNPSLEILDNVQIPIDVTIKSLVLKRTFHPDDLKRSFQIESERLDPLNRNEFNSFRSDIRADELRIPMNDGFDLFDQAKSEKFDFDDDKRIALADRMMSASKVGDNTPKFSATEKDRNKEKHLLSASQVLLLPGSQQQPEQRKSLQLQKNLLSVDKFRADPDEEVKKASQPLKLGLTPEKSIDTGKNLSPNMTQADPYLKTAEPVNKNFLSQNSANPNKLPSYQEISPSKSIELVNEERRKSLVKELEKAKSIHLASGHDDGGVHNISSNKHSFSSFFTKKIGFSKTLRATKTTEFQKSAVFEKKSDPPLRKAKSAGLNFGRSQVKPKTRILKTFNTKHVDIRATFESLMNRLKDDKAEVESPQTTNESADKGPAIFRFFKGLIRKAPQSQSITDASMPVSRSRKQDDTQLKLDEEDCCILINSKLQLSDQKEPRLLEVKLSPTVRDGKPCALILIKDTTERDLINRLQETDNYKNTLMASVSHELRTPLNCIIMMLEMLREYIGEDLISAYLNPAINSSKIQLSLVNDILDFAQIRAGKLRFTYETFNLHDLLKETLTLFEIQSKNRNVELRFDYDVRIPVMFNSDRSRVSQIVLNLLGNAIRHINQGFIILKAVFKGPNRVCIMVRDTGQGIKKENFRRLFSSFSKGDFQIGPDGFGLGLSISQTLARRLGPKDCRGIKVQSEFGRGSCFFFIVESVPTEKLSKPKTAETGMFEEKDEEVKQENKSDDDDSDIHSIEAEDKLSDDELIRPISNIRGINQMMVDAYPKRHPLILSKFPEPQNYHSLGAEIDNQKEQEPPNSDSVDTIELGTINLNEVVSNVSERDRYPRPNFGLNLRKPPTRIENQLNRPVNQGSMSHTFQNQTKSDFPSSQIIEAIQTKSFPKTTENDALCDSLKFPVKEKQSTFEELRFKEALSTHVDEKDKYSVKPIPIPGGSVDLLGVGKGSSLLLSANSRRQGSLAASPKNCKCEDILVVDDNDFNLLALRKLLDRMEFKSVQAHNGQIAINTVLEKQKSDCCKVFKIVFMDCDMPVKNGFQATRELKEMQKKGEIPNFPIVATTAYVGKREVDLCFESGMDEYLNKPVMKNKLEEVLKKWYKK